MATNQKKPTAAVKSVSHDTPPPLHEIDDKLSRKFVIEGFNPQDASDEDLINALTKKEVASQEKDDKSVLFLMKYDLYRPMSISALRRKILELDVDAISKLSTFEKTEVLGRLSVAHSGHLNTTVARQVLGSITHLSLFQRGKISQKLINSVHIPNEVITKSALLTNIAKIATAVPGSQSAFDYNAVLAPGVEAVMQDGKVSYLKKGDEYFAFDSKNHFCKYAAREDLPMSSLPVLAESKTGVVILPYMIDEYGLFKKDLKLSRYDQDMRVVRLSEEQKDIYVKTLGTLTDGTAGLDFERIARSPNTSFLGFSENFVGNMQTTFNEFKGRPDAYIAEAFKNELASQSGKTFTETLANNGYSLQTAITNITDAMAGLHGMFVNVKKYQSTFELSEDKTTVTCINELDPVPLERIYFRSPSSNQSELSPNIYKKGRKIIMSTDFQSEAKKLTAIEKASVTQKFAADSAQFSYDIVAGEGLNFCQMFNSVFSCQQLMQALEDGKFPNKAHQSLKNIGFIFEGNALQASLNSLFRLLPETSQQMLNQAFVQTIDDDAVRTAFDRLLQQQPGLNDKTRLAK